LTTNTFHSNNEHIARSLSSIPPFRLRAITYTVFGDGARLTLALAGLATAGGAAVAAAVAAVLVNGDGDGGKHFTPTPSKVVKMCLHVQEIVRNV
jgi:hypothetical protein